jgi:predicted ABC-type transport system involved in lysophospholipase L1 biosynthesis ATPase subunit
MNMTSAITVNGVSKSVISNETELTILNDISFDVLSGQSIAIVGTSGALKMSRYLRFYAVKGKILLKQNSY